MISGPWSAIFALGGFALGWILRGDAACVARRGYHPEPPAGRPCGPAPQPPPRGSEARRPESEQRQRWETPAESAERASATSAFLRGEISLNRQRAAQGLPALSGEERA